MPCLGVPPRSLAVRCGRALLGGGSPPLSPPWQPHALSAHNRSGCLRSLSSTPLMPRNGSARCRVPSSSYVPLQAWPAVPLVASWMFPLPWYPAAAGSTTVHIGASKPYLWRVSAPCSGLTLSVPAVCMSRVPAIFMSAAMSCCGCGGATILGPPILSLAPPPSPCASVARVVGGFPSPPRPRLSSPRTPSPSVGTPGVLSPRGNSATLGVSMPCSNLTPPPTPWRYPRGFSVTSEALRPPSSSLTPKGSWATPEASRPPLSPRTLEGSPARFPRQPTILPLSSGLAPWLPPATALLAAAEVAFPASTPLVASCPECPPAPLSCVPPDVTFRVSQSHPAPYAVVADPSNSVPLHPALSSALSSSPAPLARYSPPAPALLTLWWS